MLNRRKRFVPGMVLLALITAVIFTVPAQAQSEAPAGKWMYLDHALSLDAEPQRHAELQPASGRREPVGRCRSGQASRVAPGRPDDFGRGSEGPVVGVHRFHLPGPFQRGQLGQIHQLRRQCRQLQRQRFDELFPERYGLDARGGLRSAARAARGARRIRRPALRRPGALDGLADRDDGDRAGRRADVSELRQHLREGGSLERDHRGQRARSGLAAATGRFRTISTSVRARV